MLSHVCASWLEAKEVRKSIATVGSAEKNWDFCWTSIRADRAQRPKEDSSLPYPVCNDQLLAVQKAGSTLKMGCRDPELQQSKRL